MRWRSLKKSETRGDFITVARVLRPQGRRGEVAVELLTDFPEQFAQRRTLSAVFRDRSERRELQIEDFWSPGGGKGAARLVMKFAGVDSISAAEALAGCELQLPRAQRPQLEPGSAYATDLIGCRVFAVAEAQSESRAIEVGAIDDVIFGAGEAPLLVLRDPNQRELMIPFAAAYIRQLDLPGKRLVMQLPEGMLELDAPLSPEEKRAQHQK
jgi:16S rRNA processing protein RimM